MMDVLKDFSYCANNLTKDEGTSNGSVYGSSRLLNKMVGDPHRLF
ncbi:hypothetical protein [Bacteroides sp.]|nr:hypothetical protein [Bacteroides sp.]MDD3041308.1 hypothetical protein [Bacteroides sp.]